MTTTRSTPRYLVAIVGAGIHGIHVAGRLVRDHIVSPRELALIDPHEQPATAWKRRAAACGMGYLRSPAAHGVDPNFRSIRRSRGYESNQDFIPPYHRPSLERFNRHVDQFVEHSLASVSRERGTVVSVVRDGQSGEYELELGNPAERRLAAHTIILAPGQPAFFVPPEFAGMWGKPNVFHVYDGRFSPDEVSSGDRVALVGGGIGAGHLATTLANRGALVSMWIRDALYPAQFDSDPCYIGPRCGRMFRSIPDVTLRSHIIRRARRRGSVPPDMYRDLEEAAAAGRIELRRAEVVRTAEAAGRILLEGAAHYDRAASSGRRPIPTTAEYDKVVLCTGFTGGPPAPELIGGIQRTFGAPADALGFPIPHEDLSWIPGLYLSGAAAELQIGPPARNIIGAHLCGRRIVPAVAQRLGRRVRMVHTRARPAAGEVLKPGGRS